MFRPINSDDHTRFRPPVEQVKQAEGAYHGQKRDFSYEIEQINEKHKEKQQEPGEPFGEDTFEPSSDEEQTAPDSDSNSKPEISERTPPESGHVDLQA